jgi:predicted TIM-barrel fold metal-dependent hydrolase
LLATTYRGWFNLAFEQIASLSDAERDAILGGTAIRAYRLG